MKINVVVVDDEKHARDRLKKLLAPVKGLDIAGEASDGIQAVRIIDEKDPDVVFLDIQMPGATGFEVLEKITVSPKIIFVTAFDQYAVQAFEKNAVDYILKPFSKERIHKALQKVMKSPNPLGPEVLAQLQQVLARKNFLKRFSVKLGDEFLLIPQEDVFFFKSEDQYNFLHTATSRYIVDHTLKELEILLDPEVFLRVHRGAIVSLDKVKKIKRWFHGDILVQMSDGNKTKIRVGRSYQSRLKEKLDL